MCVCPQRAAEGTSCHLTGRDGAPAPILESCHEPPEDGALAVFAVLPLPVALGGPAFRDRLAPASTGWPADPAGGLDPPPPRRPLRA